MGLLVRKIKRSEARRNILGLLIMPVLALALVSALTLFASKNGYATAPNITRLSQTIGQPSGGDRVVIQGSNFNDVVDFSKFTSGGRLIALLD